MGRCAPALLILLAGGMFPPSAPAQTARGVVLASAETRVAQGDDLHALHRPLEALEVFQEVLAADPNHYDALWKAARETVSLGMLAASEDDRSRWYRTGEELARRAVAVNPNDVTGHFWLSVVLGRLALDGGSRTRVRLAEEIRREATTVLQIDSLHPGGHHVMGQWHTQVMGVNGFTRFLARRLLGGVSFSEASWSEAERHLRLAATLEPDDLIHHLELGRLYLELDRPELARESLREVLDRPAIEPTDPLHKQEAQELLKRIR